MSAAQALFMFFLMSVAGIAAFFIGKHIGYGEGVIKAAEVFIHNQLKPK